MGITSRVESDRRLILSTASEILTDEDVMEYSKWVRSNPTVREFDILMDLRGVEQVEVTSEGLRDAASLVPARDHAREDYRVAIVGQSDLVFGMSRMYEMMRAEAVGEVRVFRGLDEAKEWLGIGRK